MLELLTYLIGIILVLINSNNAQLDQRVCPGPPPTPGIDSNWRAVPSRFEIITELIAEDGLMELSQAFSSKRDSILSDSVAGSIQFYWDFNTNEKFTVATIAAGQSKVPVCLREVLTAQSKTSVINDATLIVKPSILLGYDELNQMNLNWNINLIGNGQLRGIPTNIFKSCFYVSNIQATISAIYHVSDITKFQSYLSPGESIILQIDVNITKANSKIETYSYNVFRYIPNPSRREERQALETPTGVYCPNRILTKEVPSNIPERVSANGETIVPTYNNTIISTHNLYDTEFQFTRNDLYYPDPLGGPRWYHYTELHDFAVGLSYHYNHTSHQCTVFDINTGFGDAVTVSNNASLIQMGDPQHLFLMDDIVYQYTGEKQCRDRVWCHVWIGEKPMPNNTFQHQEWYWASRVNGEELTQWIPMKFILKQSYEGFVVAASETNVFNFRRNPFTIFEVDYTLADCYRSLGPSENYNFAVLSFKIVNDKNYPVLENINYLRFHIWETLTFAMFVRPIRISHLIVDKDNNNNDILVTFTLLDAPPRTGPVEFPLRESSLDSLIYRLNTVINTNSLIFRARSSNKQVVLKARADTLNVMFSSANQNNQCNKEIIIEKDNRAQCPDPITVQNENIEIVYNNSGPLIVGLWIGFIILGVILGNVAGFFVLKRFQN